MTGLPREFIANHLNIDLFAHVVPHRTDKIFVNPWLELAHPGCIISIIFFPNVNNDLGQFPSANENRRRTVPLREFLP